VSDPRLDKGAAVRREVLGDPVGPAPEASTAFTEPFHDLVREYLWGEIWARPGLDRRTRLHITLAILTALRSRNEIPMYVRAALREGVTPEELQEVLLHTAIYAGVPAANGAFEIVRETLAGETEPVAPDKDPSPEDNSLPTA
jgi:alkylhydroperoxidase/carboxymuconolactone decarboxylase family protein YurZ